MNKVILVGRLTKDIEIREIKSSSKGKPDSIVANFTLAVDDKKSGETAFINCVAWNTLASTLEQYTKKGQPIEICGRIRTHSYEKNSETRFVTEVLIEGFEFCPTNIPPEKEVKKYGRK